MQNDITPTLPGRPEDYIEGPVGSGQWWLLIDAENAEVFGPINIRPDWTPHDLFAKREMTSKRLVPKSVITSRLIDSGKIEAAYKILNSNPIYWARWVAPDKPSIYYDDPDALALFKAIGVDPEIIMAE